MYAFWKTKSFWRKDRFTLFDETNLTSVKELQLLTKLFSNSSTQIDKRNFIVVDVSLPRKLRDEPSQVKSERKLQNEMDVE